VSDDDKHEPTTPTSYEQWVRDNDVYVVLWSGNRRNRDLASLRMLINEYPDAAADMLRELGYVVRRPGD
jgi:hypothetical protein